VYYTTDTGVSWQPLGTGLPFSAVDDLVFHNGTRVLRAATHGRSFFEFDLDQIGIKEKEELSEIELKGIALQVTNPARNEILVRYNISETSHVRMGIYDVAGRSVRNLVNESMSAGKYAFSTRIDLPAGTYFIRLEAQGKRATQKIDVVK